MARGTEAVLRDRTQLGAFDRIRAIKEGKGRRSAFLEDSASDGPDSPDPPTPREPAKRVDRTRSLSLSESDGKENAQRARCSTATPMTTPRCARHGVDSSRNPRYTSPTSPSPSQTGAYPSGAPYAASDARSAGASSTPSQIHRHHHPTTTRTPQRTPTTTTRETPMTSPTHSAASPWKPRHPSRTAQSPRRSRRRCPPLKRHPRASPRPLHPTPPSRAVPAPP